MVIFYLMLCQGKKEEDILRMDSIKIDLKEEEKRLQQTISQFEADLNAVRRLIQRHSIPQQLELGGSNSIIHPKPIGVTESVSSLFEEYPKKEWSPSDIREWLVRMKERGELKSKAGEFLSAAHTVIKKLRKKGKIIIARQETDPLPRKWFIKNESGNVETDE